MTATSLALDEIGQLSITVKDLDRAVSFYRDTLGMRFLFEAPPKMAFFDCGGIRLMLSVPEKAEFDHPPSVIYYKVDDIEAAHRALVEKEVEFEGEPHLIHQAEGYELWMAFLRDSEGHLLALMTERGSLTGS